MADWTPDTESYSTDGPQCPQCGFTFTPDEGHYFDEAAYTEDACPECYTTFKVEVHHSVSWTCEIIAVANSSSTGENT
jgi:hypothetical protein